MNENSEDKPKSESPKSFENSTNPAPNAEAKPIIFFDGVCGLCNSFVDIVMKLDRAQQFLFSPLQGETAKKLLTQKQTEDLDSVILYDNGVTYSKSDAVLEIFNKIGGFLQLWMFTKIIPKNLRDHVYDLAAEQRYKIFGKREACRIPTPEERARFLD